MNQNMQNKTVNIHEQKKINLNISVFTQGFLVLMMVAVVLYTLLFSTYPPLHDTFHELKHSLMFIPCH